MWATLISFLQFLTGGVVVRRKRIPLMLACMRDSLKEQSFAHEDKISDSVGLVILEEAYRRAGERSKDGKARSRDFIAETQRAAKAIVAAFEGNPEADPRIRSILVFHKIL
jgi:hypothetical protein